MGNYYDQVSLGLFIVEVLGSHSYSTHPAGLLRKSDSPDAETSTW